MPVATQDLIDEVLAQVAEALPELQVALYPAVPTTFRLNHPLGALLLTYPGSSSGESVNLCSTAQPRTVRLGWTLVTRQLWGDDGAATLLDRLREALVGYVPVAGASPIQHANERVLAEEGGLWWYAAEFTCVLYP